MEPGAPQKWAWNSFWQKKREISNPTAIYYTSGMSAIPEIHDFGDLWASKVSKNTQKNQTSKKTPKNTKKYQNVVKMGPQEPPRGTLKVIKKPPCPPLGPQMGQKCLPDPPQTSKMRFQSSKMSKKVPKTRFLGPKKLQKNAIVPPLQRTHFQDKMRDTLEKKETSNQETKKSRSQETKKPRTLETKRPRNRETKTPSIQQTKKPRTQETKRKPGKQETRQGEKLLQARWREHARSAIG